MSISVFLAYPSNPPEISNFIHKAVNEYRMSYKELDIHLWEQNDVSGRPITKEIFERIESCDFLFADITNLNFNVVFEIGYAIGLSKRTILFRSTQYDHDDALRRATGIFDTIGHEKYSSSADIVKLFLAAKDQRPLPIPDTRDTTTLVYTVEPTENNADFQRIVSRLNKLNLAYRSFNPYESRRISVVDAIEHVSRSTGIVLLIIDHKLLGAREHNIRSSFVAGLSMALGRELLILVPDGVRVPLDFADVSYSFHSPNQVDEHIKAFAFRTFIHSRDIKEGDSRKSGLLEDLSLGDPTAENEIQTLESYFVPTAQYDSALRGEVDVAVGRKGSGKTALFSQVRSRMQKDRENIVIDLKPESYQLIRLREEILARLNEGAQLHLIKAFWEYIILLERRNPT